MGANDIPDLYIVGIMIHQKALSSRLMEDMKHVSCCHYFSLMIVLFVSSLEKTNRLFYLDAKVVATFGSSGKLSFFFKL